MNRTGRSHRYRVVDVFTEQPLEGNPLAVFPQASDLETETMQRIARELNLSETVFILPPTRADCAARVRIFTPAREMAFAGHPTVGSGFVLIDEGRVPREGGHFLLEENVGPVPVRVDGGERPIIWLTTPAVQRGRICDAAVCAQALGLDREDILDAAPQYLSAGNPALFVVLRSKTAVDRAWIDASGMKLLRSPQDDVFCVFIFTPTSEGAYARMFAPDHGIAEDPATGSATGPLAVYMMQHGFIPEVSGTRFFSEQGTKMGRRSILHVEVRGRRGEDGIDVGGHVTPLVEATMKL